MARSGLLALILIGLHVGHTLLGVQAEGLEQLIIGLSNDTYNVSLLRRTRSR